MKKCLYTIYSFIFFSTVLFAQNSEYQITLPITSQVSVMRIGTDPHPQPNEVGKKAAALIWDCIENNNKAAAAEAIKTYEELIQKETRIGDCSSLKWLCECIIASEEEKLAKLRTFAHELRVLLELL